MSADNGVEVVMNACTVRHFLTGPWPNRSEDHILKVTVRRHIHQGELCFEKNILDFKNKCIYELNFNYTYIYYSLNNKQILAF
jgi:hypothetical protein